MTNIFVTLIALAVILLTIFIITFVSAAMIGVLLSLLGLEVHILEHALVYAKYSVLLTWVVIVFGMLSGRLDIRTEDEK